MLKDQEHKAIPSYSALQLDSLESLLVKWKAATGQRGTEGLKSCQQQYKDWLAAQPVLLHDLARQGDPALNERHRQLITRANALLDYSAIALARKGEAGHLMGAQFAE